jgi:hypothetical protein
MSRFSAFSATVARDRDRWRPIKHEMYDNAKREFQKRFGADMDSVQDGQHGSFAAPRSSPQRRTSASKISIRRDHAVNNAQLIVASAF